MKTRRFVISFGILTLIVLGISILRVKRQNNQCMEVVEMYYERYK